MGPQPAFLGVTRLTEATGYKIAIRLFDKEEKIVLLAQLS
jgi:hypothetical protein